MVFDRFGVLVITFSVLFCFVFVFVVLSLPLSAPGANQGKMVSRKDRILFLSACCEFFFPLRVHIQIHNKAFGTLRCTKDRSHHMLDLASLHSGTIRLA